LAPEAETWETSMKIPRRRFLGMTAAIGAYANALVGQMASHTSKSQSRMAPSGKPFHSRLTDIASQAGLTSPVICGEDGRSDYILETNGCGCAFIDYDNDGWMDLFVLSGTRRNGAPPGTTNRLYKNNRDGTFTDVTEKAGLHREGWACAVCVGDYNNDAFEDLFCTYYGQNVLYRNNGDGTFTDVTREAGLTNDPHRWGSGCSFIDYDRDGNLDLFVSNYLQFDFNTVKGPGSSSACTWKNIPVMCGPRGLPPSYHSLYHNNGDGTFTDVSEKAGIAKARGSYGMTVVSADFDDDGWPDILVACDATPSLLFMNSKNGSFSEEGLYRGISLDDDGMEQAGMGVAIGDPNLQGRLDVYITHFTDDTNNLYMNDGKGYFEDGTLAARLGVDTRYVCWGTGMVDLDNDGWPDIFVVAGNVFPSVEKVLAQYPYKCPRMVYRNLGNGTFEELIEEAGPGVAEPHSSRGCAFGDFDNDGDIDVVIMNMNEPPSLLRNDVQGGSHWLKVKLIGSKSNRSAIGARVTVFYGAHKQTQALLSQSSYYSANDSRLHFGLGSENAAEIEIRWPSGLTEKLTGIPADRLVTIQEGKGIVPSKGWSK
jgi:enediyne biosynthesis protein E4